MSAGRCRFEGFEGVEGRWLVRGCDVHARESGRCGGFGGAVNVVLWVGGDQRGWAVEELLRRGGNGN